MRDLAVGDLIACRVSPAFGGYDGSHGIVVRITSIIRDGADRRPGDPPSYWIADILADGRIRADKPVYRQDILDNRAQGGHWAD